MPVSFNSPARNLFLLGSTGGTVVTNFFKTILDSSTDGVFIAREIAYNYSEQNYILSGFASDSNSANFGWLEKRDYNSEVDPPTSTLSFRNKVVSTEIGYNSTASAELLDIHLDYNDNIIACGIANDFPWISKYSNAGVLEWQSTTNSGNVAYKNITSYNGVYYASGNTESADGDVAFIEKFDANGNPGWGKAATALGKDINLDGLAANSRGHVVAVGHVEDDSRFKGYIVKIDTISGEVMWDKTLSSSEKQGIVFTPVLCEDVFIDDQDNIYVCGRLQGVPNGTRSFVMKLSPEGNIIWQRETAENFEYYRVKADGATGQVVVFGRYYDAAGNDQGGVIAKYSRGGEVSWRRTLFSSYAGSNFFGRMGENGGIALDADPSFYYVLYTDDDIDGLSGTPDAYTFGKVSTSGNGLGPFEYDDGESETVFYDIINSDDRVGRLQDGSVRYDISDLATYPFNATRIAFDDYATPVANKKRQMDDAGNFEYSGSPAVRPVDFGSMNLMGDVGEISASDGPELVQNGTFDSDVSGWTAETSTINWSNGKLQTNRSGGSGYTSYQVIPTEIGKRYTVRATVESTGTGARQDIRVLSDLSTNGGSVLSTNPGNGSNGFTVNVEVHFTAVGTTSYVYTVSDDIGTGFFDNISVKESAIWSDQSGKGNNSIVNGPTYNSGGGYWEFDATNYRVIFGPKCNELFEDGGGGTIEMWVKMNDVSPRQTLCSGYMDDPNRWDFEVSSGSVQGGFHDNGYSSSNSTTTNTWYNFMFVLDKSGGNGEIRFYINGVEDPNWSGSLTVDRDFATDVEFGIGNRYLQQEDFPLDGDIAEVRIYPRTLTEAQIFQNYDAARYKYDGIAANTSPKIGPDIVYDNLVLNYDFGNDFCIERFGSIQG